MSLLFSLKRNIDHVNVNIENVIVKGSFAYRSLSLPHPKKLVTSSPSSSTSSMPLSKSISRTYF